MLRLPCERWQCNPCDGQESCCFIEEPDSPKFELMAAVIILRVAAFIRDALQLQDAPTYFWGDGQIVLHWLASTKQLP